MEWLRPLLQELMSDATAHKIEATDKLLTSAEACALFGVSKTTLIDWRKRDLVPFLRLGKKIRFEESAVREAARAHSKFQRKK